ncbi:MAG: PhoH family protein, partial [Gemmatimonadales bacterium]|nr:PhoH family protein [Gemmatimonadales bacterium]
MADETIQRFGIEGADPLLLAGVNDANLVELGRVLGVRAALRGDTLMVSGPGEQVDRAGTVIQALIDLARMGDGVTPDVITRMAQDGAVPPELTTPGEGRILLPGLRRAILPKTQGQKDYLQAIAQNDIVIGIGPAGTGKTYLAVAKAIEALARKRVRRIILARPAVEAGESLGFLP